jgi:ubiquinone/menaquinone biosynthesis C-methylase UbiE
MDTIWKPAAPRQEEIDEVLCRRRERDELFLRHGLDRAASTRFVIDSAEPLEDRVLDIGTGKGLAAVEMARRGARVTTVDLSEKDLRDAFLLASGAGVRDRIEFHRADARALPFGDDSFALATMVNVVHHLEDAPATLAEIARVLAPGGRLVISDFTDSGFEILERIHREEEHVHERHAGGTIDGLARHFDRLGLRCRSRDSRFHQYVMGVVKS